MIVELKGHFLGSHSNISKSNGNIYYTADVYCDEDGDTVRISVPATLFDKLNDGKKFADVCWRVSIRNHPEYGMKITLAE